MENTNNKITLQTLIIPLAIIIAGAFIAFGIYMTGTSKAKLNEKVKMNKEEIVKSLNIPPVTSADHVLGDIKTAKVIVIEYSDLECPFCKTYHQTMEKIYDEYKSTGKVAWVFRHAPIIQLHRKAPKEAEATECATELGGNTAFWKYLSELFTNTPSNNALAQDKLYEFADTVGLDAKAFKACLDGGKYASKINEQTILSGKAGVSMFGTPYTVLVVDGKTIPLISDSGDGLGALPYAQMKSVLGEFLK